MRRNPVHRSLRCVCVAVVIAGWLLVTAFAAGASAPHGDTVAHGDAVGAPAGRSAIARRAEVERASGIERWKGRFCPPTGCAGAGSSPWGTAAGFGVAVLATGWIARRPSPRR